MLNIKNILNVSIVIGQISFTFANPALPVDSPAYHKAMGIILLGYFEDYVVYSLDANDFERGKMLIDDFSVYSFQYFYRVRYEGMERSQQWERGVWRTAARIRGTKLERYFIEKIRDPLEGTGMKIGERSRFPKIDSKAEYSIAVVDFEGFMRGFGEFLISSNQDRDMDQTVGENLATTSILRHELLDYKLSDAVDVTPDFIGELEALNIDKFFGNAGLDQSNFLFLGDGIGNEKKRQGCVCKGHMELDSYRITLKLSAADYVIRDGEGYIRDFLIECSRGNFKEAERKRFLWADAGMSVQDNAKAWLKYLGIPLNIGSNTGGSILWGIELSSAFKCLSGGENDLFICKNTLGNYSRTLNGIYCVINLLESESQRELAISHVSAVIVRSVMNHTSQP